MVDAAIAEACTTLRLQHRFEATPARVFQAWTQPEALRRWWCPAGWLPVDIAVDFRVGGGYRLSMVRESGVRRVTVEGRFLEIQPVQKLVYTWRWDGAFPDLPETRVTVEFRPVRGGTDLTLQQESLPMPVCVRHATGWLDAFARIERLTSELDGRADASSFPVDQRSAGRLG
jgi:uncharacterized protein YndB with AHSA1/START domain